MKTELRADPHSVTGVTILELWHDGQFIATVTDGPGVRVISKHAMQVVHIEGEPNVVEVRVYARVMNSRIVGESPDMRFLINPTDVSCNIGLLFQSCTYGRRVARAGVG
jgi:hypothetical protein